MNRDTSTGTTARQEIRRADDDELLGFVAVDPDGSGNHLASTGFGGLLGSHPDADSAEQQVREVGLSSLAERWWIFADGQWQHCWLIEASPDRVVAVISSYAFTARPEVIPSGTPLQLSEPDQ